jgi:hypothetical protein
MARRQQQADRALRPAMRSPGRPIPARHVERAFWWLIAQGKRTEEAALEIGVSTPVAVRWFRHAGGMAATCSGKPDYRASVAQWKAQTAAQRPKPAELASNPRLQDYVQTRLSGQLQRPDGTVAAGPPTTWKGLNKPHRADRRWATAWSPEQISRRLVHDFPDDVDMRISHEAIYQALYIQGRGALKRELVACLLVVCTGVVDARDR